MVLVVQVKVLQIVILIVFLSFWNSKMLTEVDQLMDQLLTFSLKILVTLIKILVLIEIVSRPLQLGLLEMLQIQFLKKLIVIVKLFTLKL